MSAVPPIGNDVVDLGDPRCGGKAGHERFLRRVFHPSEADRIRSSPDPDHALWLHWAAKEAAFKVVSKLVATPPPFVHAAYRVDPEREVVRHGQWTVAFRVEAFGERIHVVAVEGDAEGWLAEVASGMGTLSEGTWPDPELEAHFSAREREGVHSRASAEARLRARAALAVRLGVTEGRIEIVTAGGRVGRTPPRVLLDGEPAPADASLSHHGRWVAWALAVA